MADKASNAVQCAPETPCCRSKDQTKQVFFSDICFPVEGQCHQESKPVIGFIIIHCSDRYYRCKQCEIADQDRGVHRYSHKHCRNKEKSKDIDNQTDSFKKRLAEKKKKWVMNTSDIGQSSNLQSKNLVVFNTKKYMNRSFDAVDKDDSIFSNDISIEPISMYNASENTLNINEGINNNLDFYFSDFDNIFNEKVTKAFIDQLSEITKDKISQNVIIAFS